MAAANEVPSFLVSSVKYLEWLQVRYGLVISRSASGVLEANLGFAMPHIRQLDRFGYLGAVFMG